jgi:hypothetical protein
MNWYMGKQAKHMKEVEMGRKRSKLGELLYRYAIEQIIQTQKQHSADIV